VALNASNGEELWRYKYTLPVLSIHGYSSPLIVPGGVLIGLENGQLLALSIEEGKVIWQTPISRPEGRSEIERLVDVDGVIAIDGQYIYAVDYEGRLVQIEPSKGRIIWSRPLTSISGVSVDSNAVYVTEPDGYVWALDKKTGSSLWKMDKLEGRRLTRPVPISEYLLVGDFEGYLHLLSKFDGSTVGRFEVDASPIVAVPSVVNDNELIVQSRAGVLRKLNIKTLKAK
jgi:outer membrane protein assembly factor BamB